MKTIKYKNKQKGVALVIGMILLLIISVIGITSMKSALLQEKMAAGLKNREIADAAAMSLLVNVEKWLYDYYQEGNGVVLTAGVHEYVIDSGSIQSTDFRNNRDLLGGSELAGAYINAQYGNILASEPRFIIESIDVAPISVGSGGGGGRVIGSAVYDEGSVAGGGGRLLLYKIVSKATDTTGNLYSAFESVISVKTR